MSVAHPELREQCQRAAGLPDEALLAECEVEVFVASGPGGQHRNKTESGVRLRHLPTGTTAIATERRSQHQNRQAALRRLRERLARKAFVPRPRKKTRPTRASQLRRLSSKRAHAEKKKRRRELD